MKICVIGLGYIGLPTSAMFAKNNIDVIGVDINKKAVDTINEGKIHIEEPGLAEVVREVVLNGKLKAYLTPKAADAFIIAVPTPYNNDEFHSCDLTYVIQAVKDILPYVRKKNIVIVESTIGPRTMDDHIKPIFEEAGFTIGEDLFLSHCPERVLPGQILYELENNNRIIGGITPACTEKAAELYKVFVKGEIIKTEAKTAEMSKLMENTYRDVNIALANELAKICKRLEINVLDVIEMANKHPRVNIHRPGPGVGGHCIAIDPYFIYAAAPEEAKLIKQARDINSSMPEYVVDIVEQLLNKNKKAKIAAFGITYKGNVDDTRESPALEIINILQKKKYYVDIYDPHVTNETIKTYEEALKDANLLLVLTDHNEFKEMDFSKIEELMEEPIIFDTRGIIKNNPNFNVKVINYGTLYEVKKKVDLKNEIQSVE